MCDVWLTGVYSPPCYTQEHLYNNHWLWPSLFVQVEQFTLYNHDLKIQINKHKHINNERITLYLSAADPAGDRFID